MFEFQKYCLVLKRLNVIINRNSVRCFTYKPNILEFHMHIDVTTLEPKSRWFFFLAPARLRCVIYVRRECAQPKLVTFRTIDRDNNNIILLYTVHRTFCRNLNITIYIWRLLLCAYTSIIIALGILKYIPDPGSRFSTRYRIVSVGLDIPKQLYIITLFTYL